MSRHRRASARRSVAALATVVVSIAMAAVPWSMATAGASSSTTTTSTSAPSTTTTSSTSGRGGGCGKTVAVGSSRAAVRVGGHTRTVIVHVPASYTAIDQVALVLNMHGSGSTAAEQELFSGMDTESETAGFIVAYPQALVPSGSGFDWNIPGVVFAPAARPPAHPADDMAFLTQLVPVLEHRYCISPTHVYVTGFSGGARMASQLACNDSNIFAAVAPVSGLRWPDPCPSVRSVSILSFHGTADPIDPYRGHGQSYWTYSVPQAARDWAGQDDCRATPRTSSPDPGVTLTRYVGCPARTTVELYTIAGEGHEWPGGPMLRPLVTRILGPQSDAVDADAVMWAFFKAHPLT